MKEFDITTKKGQRELLKAMKESFKIGFEDGEENIKEYQSGYIQALKDILAQEEQRFIMNGTIFYNQKKGQ